MQQEDLPKGHEIAGGEWFQELLINFRNHCVSNDIREHGHDVRHCTQKPHPSPPR
jgi:hypothetical protein